MKNKGLKIKNSNSMVKKINPKEVYNKIVHSSRNNNDE